MCGGVIRRTMNNYLKTFGPILLTLITVGYTVWGTLPWYAPVAAGLSAVLTYLLKNTEPVTVSDETAKPEYKPENTVGQNGGGLMGLAPVTAAAVAATDSASSTGDPEVTKLKAALVSLKGRVTALEKKISGKS